MVQSSLPKRPAKNPRFAAVAILRRLQEFGHVAYFAGGCVRDSLLGLEPKDYDVATDATPDRVQMLFPKSRLVGEAFGVVLVRMMGFDVEVATFRVEWGYTDGRHPGKVKFSDAEHDARRRDFTVNGLFENPMARRKADRIIDYVGGRQDLAAKVLRAIGIPAERFGEDYLRMLRAVRFASRLGFSLHENTAAAIPPLAERLIDISRERIGQEVMLMLSPSEGGALRRVAAIDLIQRLTLDAPVLTEEHQDAELDHVRALPDVADYMTVLAAWALDRGRTSGDDIAAWRGALCLSNEHRDGLERRLQLFEQAQTWADLDTAGRKRLLAENEWPQALLLLPTDLREVIERDAVPLLNEGVAPEPWITGNDLIDLGRKPGPSFRRLLDQVYDAQLDGTVQSRDEALDWLRKQE